MRFTANLSLNLLLFVASISSIATASIINNPDDQPTIQSGINTATVGDTVLVLLSAYLENNSQIINEQKRDD